MRASGIASAAVVLSMFAAPSLGQQGAPQQPMSFFVTSVGLGDGANLDGLAGADSQCQTLAASVGRGNTPWRAYLSQAPSMGLPLIDARARIGNGPWYNANGVVIAWSLDDLHEDRNNLRKPTALDENGEEVNGSGDEPNRHDILTGSDSTGRLVSGNGAFTTCNNWTSNGEGTAIVGHHDRLGGPSASWNSVHSSRGCSQDDLAASGGAGLFYCFAVE